MAETKDFRFNYRNYPTITSPKLTLKWPKLVTPGKKYKSEDLEFTTDCVMPEAEGEEWAEKVLKPLVDKALAEFVEDERNKKKAKITKANYNFMKPEIDKEGDPTGNVQFKVKTNAVRLDKDKIERSVEIPLWDASGKRIQNGSVNPYGGTTARVKFDVMPYFMEKDKEVGISFKLREVQIIKLIEGGERAPSGFDEVDDEDAYRQDEGGGFKETSPDADDGEAENF